MFQDDKNHSSIPRFIQNNGRTFSDSIIMSDDRFSPNSNLEFLNLRLPTEFARELFSLAEQKDARLESLGIDSMIFEGRRLRIASQNGLGSADINHSNSSNSLLLPSSPIHDLLNNIPELADIVQAEIDCPTYEYPSISSQASHSLANSSIILGDYGQVYNSAPINNAQVSRTVSQPAQIVAQSHPQLQTHPQQSPQQQQQPPAPQQKQSLTPPLPQQQPQQQLPPAQLHQPQSLPQPQQQQLATVHSIRPLSHPQQSQQVSGPPTSATIIQRGGPEGGLYMIKPIMTSIVSGTDSNHSAATTLAPSSAYIMIPNNSASTFLISNPSSLQPKIVQSITQPRSSDSVVNHSATGQNQAGFVGQNHRSNLESQATSGNSSFVNIVTSKSSQSMISGNSTQFVSSPLLINLLQNDSPSTGGGEVGPGSNVILNSAVTNPNNAHQQAVTSHENLSINNNNKNNNNNNNNSSSSNNNNNSFVIGTQQQNVQLQTQSLSLPLVHQVPNVSGSTSTVTSGSGPNSNLIQMIHSNSPSTSKMMMVIRKCDLPSPTSPNVVTGSANQKNASNKRTVADQAMIASRVLQPPQTLEPEPEKPKTKRVRKRNTKKKDELGTLISTVPSQLDAVSLADSNNSNSSEPSFKPTTANLYEAPITGISLSLASSITGRTLSAATQQSPSTNKRINPVITALAQNVIPSQTLGVASATLSNQSQAMIADAVSSSNGQLTTNSKIIYIISKDSSSFPLSSLAATPIMATQPQTITTTAVPSRQSKDTGVHDASMSVKPIPTDSVSRTLNKSSQETSQSYVIPVFEQSSSQVNSLPEKSSLKRQTPFDDFQLEPVPVEFDLLQSNHSSKTESVSTLKANSNTLSSVTSNDPNGSDKSLSDSQPKAAVAQDTKPTEPTISGDNDKKETSTLESTPSKSSYGWLSGLSFGNLPDDILEEDDDQTTPMTTTYITGSIGSVASKGCTLKLTTPTSTPTTECSTVTPVAEVISSVKSPVSKSQFAEATTEKDSVEETSQESVSIKTEDDKSHVKETLNAMESSTFKSSNLVKDEIPTTLIKKEEDDCESTKNEPIFSNADLDGGESSSSDAKSITDSGSQKSESQNSPGTGTVDSQSPSEDLLKSNNVNDGKDNRSSSMLLLPTAATPTTLNLLTNINPKTVTTSIVNVNAEGAHIKDDKKSGEIKEQNRTPRKRKASNLNEQPSEEMPDKKFKQQTSLLIPKKQLLTGDRKLFSSDVQSEATSDSSNASTDEQAKVLNTGNRFIIKTADGKMYQKLICRNTTPNAKIPVSKFNIQTVVSATGSPISAGSSPGMIFMQEASNNSSNPENPCLDGTTKDKVIGFISNEALKMKAVTKGETPKSIKGTKSFFSLPTVVSSSSGLSNAVPVSIISTPAMKNGQIISRPVMIQQSRPLEIRTDELKSTTVLSSQINLTTATKSGTALNRTATKSSATPTKLENSAVAFGSENTASGFQPLQTISIPAGQVELGQSMIMACHNQPQVITTVYNLVDHSKGSMKSVSLDDQTGQGGKIFKKTDIMVNISSNKMITGVPYSVNTISNASITEINSNDGQRVLRNITSPAKPQSKRKYNRKNTVSEEVIESGSEAITLPSTQKPRKTYSRTTRANLPKSVELKVGEKPAASTVAEECAGPAMQKIDLDSSAPLIVNGLSYAAPISNSEMNIGSNSTLQTFGNTGYVNMILDTSMGQISSPVSVPNQTDAVSTSHSSMPITTSTIVVPTQGNQPQTMINSSLIQFQGNNMLVSGQFPNSAGTELANVAGAKKTRRSTSSSSVSKPSLRSNSGTEILTPPLSTPKRRRSTKETK